MLWQMEKLLVLSNFSFCNNVFKMSSAADLRMQLYEVKRIKCISTPHFVSVYEGGIEGSLVSVTQFWYKAKKPLPKLYVHAITKC